MENAVLNVMFTAMVNQKGFSNEFVNQPETALKKFDVSDETKGMLLTLSEEKRIGEPVGNGYEFYMTSKLY